MIGNDAFCWSRTACGKTLASPFSVMLSAIVSSSLVYREGTFADGCPEPSFAVARTFAAGPNPVSVAVGDFNGDAKPDLAVANDANMDNISVLLGKGDGSFLAASNYSAGSNPQCVVAEDFNRDGKPDLVVSSASGVFVLLGKGDGTFQAPINSGPPGASLAAGDFNADGRPDLAVVGFDGTVSVLLCRGDGTFQPAVTYGAGTFPNSVAVGDFNGDRKPDLVVANRGSGSIPGYLSVLLGRGDGSFQAAINYGAGGGAFAVATGDFNGDDKADFAVANDEGLYGGVSVLLGNGGGTFGAAVSYGGRLPRSVALGDFNGDGKPDLALANYWFDNVSVLLGNGDGTFQIAVTYATGNFPLSVATGDFNSDGKPDLAVANFGGVDLARGIPSVSVLLNTCVSTDNSLDIARRNTSTAISWPLQFTQFALETATNLTLPNWGPAVEAPITNNGRLEIVVPLDRRERYFRLRKP